MLGTKKCPFCRKLIFKKATVCQFCTKELGDVQEDTQNPTSYWKLALKRWYLHLFFWPISLPIEYFNYLGQRNENREHDTGKTDGHGGSSGNLAKGQSSDSQAPLLSSNARRILALVIIWLLAGSFGVVFYLEPESPWLVWLGFFFLALAIWMHARKGEQVFGGGGNALQDRIKNFKQHKIRLTFTIIAFLFAIPTFAVHLSNEIKADKLYAQKEEERLEQEAEAKRIEDYPKPSIEILSDQGHQGGNMEYDLVVEAKDATLVRAGTQSMVQDETDKELFTLSVPLPSPTTVLNVVAKNEYKETKQSIEISRNETHEETQAKLEREIYKAVNERMDAIYDEPNRAYLESSALMDEYDAIQIKEVAQIYGISVEEVEAIYKAQFISDYDDPARTTPDASSATLNNSTSAPSIPPNGSNDSDSLYYGTCREYDDGTVVGCEGNDFCKLETEWQQGEVHYFEGRCVKR